MKTLTSAPVKKKKKVWHSEDRIMHMTTHIQMKLMQVIKMLDTSTAAVKHFKKTIISFMTYNVFKGSLGNAQQCGVASLN